LSTSVIFCLLMLPFPFSLVQVWPLLHLHSSDVPHLAPPPPPPVASPPPPVTAAISESAVHSYVAAFDSCAAVPIGPLACGVAVCRPAGGGAPVRRAAHALFRPFRARELRADLAGDLEAGRDEDEGMVEAEDDCEDEGAGPVMRE